jgi:hypothetical protein
MSRLPISTTSGLALDRKTSLVLADSALETSANHSGGRNTTKPKPALLEVRRSSSIRKQQESEGTADDPRVRWLVETGKPNPTMIQFHFLAKNIMQHRAAKVRRRPRGEDLSAEEVS